jgi:hypothetical protein
MSLKCTLMPQELELLQPRSAFDILAAGCISGAVTRLSDFLVLCRRMIPSLVAIQLLSVLYFVDTMRGYLRKLRLDSWRPRRPTKLISAVSN